MEQKRKTLGLKFKNYGEQNKYNKQCNITVILYIWGDLYVFNYKLSSKMTAAVNSKFGKM